MNSEKGINPKIVYWLTFIGIVVNIICLVVFVKGVSESGDTGIAMWAIFLFSFFLVAIPLHMLLLVLALVQSFLVKQLSYKWLYVYLIITFTGFIAFAAKLGAFDNLFGSASDYPQLTSAELIMQRANNGGPQADIEKVKKALAEGLDANSSLRQGSVPYLVGAAKNADAPTIAVLLQAGADPNKKSSTPYILSFGVTINNPSPLDVVMFSESGNIRKSIELLLAAGAKPQDTLMILGACRKGDLELFDYAVELTPSLIIEGNVLVDGSNKNCIHHAAESNRVSFLQKILSADELNIAHLLTLTNESNQFPLDVALTKKHYAAAIEIVKAGGKANQKKRIKRALENTSPDPSLRELQTLLLKQNSDE